MKNASFKILLFLFFLFMGSPFPGVTVTAGENPRILSIQPNRGKLLVHVEVPAGLKKVTLQTRTRVSGSVWIPRAVNRLDGSGGTTSFIIPKSAAFELIRVQAEAADPLPESFYAGPDTFPGAATQYNPDLPGGIFNGGTTAGSTTGTSTGGTTAGSTGGMPGTPENQGGNRTVVESDIWKVEGHFVYFFNTYRGLQVIDASNPDLPTIKGQYLLPASGEQMYVRDGVVILLAQVSCSAYDNSTQSEVIILDANEPAIQPLARFAVPGTIRESRLVGDALYVVSQTYEPRENGNWEHGTAVTSLDLSNLSTPVQKQRLWIPGSGNVIAATEKYLFVVQNYYGTFWPVASEIQLIDISSPTGEMEKLGRVNPAGQVADKFKINVNGNTVTIISHSNQGATGMVTVLENFSLENPLLPTRIATLQLAEGEQLHATRFDGDRAYIVTFRRVDPLWVIDLSDPVRPRIAGELEVPGWSTYIKPLGDRLVAIGIDVDNGWRVAVSLFDVSNPANPTLVDKEFLGENHSWSEANNDEKAFNVLPDAGLILVPYQGYLTNGYAQRVQLIDFDRNSLTRRGQIDHSFQPRRAGMLQDRILSISSKELITVKATNRDEPEVTSTLTLSAHVSKVYPVGNYLVTHGGQEINQGKSSSPLIQVAANSAPTLALKELRLAREMPVIGSALRGNYLYLLQPGIGYSTSAQEGTNPPPATLTVIDVSALPELNVASTTSVPIPLTAYTTVESLWPADDTLVFKTTSGYMWYYWDVPDIGNPVGGGTTGGAIGAGAIWSPYPYWGGESQFLGFDLSEDGKGRFASVVTLKSTAWWGSNKAFAMNNLIFTSHTEGEEQMIVSTPGGATGEVYDPLVPRWFLKHKLDVIDYTDPYDPVRRPSASLPNMLQGVSHQGNMLYTHGVHYTAEGLMAGSTNWIDALVYDGVSAHLLDSLLLQGSYSIPFHIAASGHVYLGTAPMVDIKPEVTASRINEGGKFEQVARVELTKPATALTQVNDILLVQSDRVIIPFESVISAEGFALNKLGTGTSTGCIYPDLNRAEGSRLEGIWLPLLDYGFLRIDGN